MSYSINPVGENVLKKRYYQKDDAGNFVEDWAGLAHRVVDFVCKDESEGYKKEIYDIILKTEFLPNTPCLVNAGRANSRGGLSACYVTKAPEDTWKDIVKNIERFGDVARAAGGCGVSFTKIRPEGDKVFGSSHAKACGPIEAMRMVSEAMSSITQSGIRGMANMGTIHVSHPDVLNFIKCKRHERALKTLLKEDIGRNLELLTKSRDLNVLLDKFISNFNISVFVNDEFMRAVENDENWDLKFNGKTYSTVKAKELFYSIAENAWNNGDPGLLFEDRINDGPYKLSKQWIDATNPCFHGDSMVAVADGRNFVSIKQLAEEGKDVPVYCCNPKTGDINIRWGRNPRKTRENVNLCKVNFDDGGSVITTPDHRILLRNGQYVEVKNLLVGDSVMSMTKFEYISHRSKYLGVIHGDGKPTKSEHKMIYEFLKDAINDGELIHHKDFNGLNNDINNLQKMTFEEHSIYHRQFNNPMTHWYPNATAEEKQRYHDNMSKSTAGEKNRMYGRRHKKETLYKIGQKTKERCADKEYRKKISVNTRNAFDDKLKNKISNDKKKHWEAGLYDSLKSPVVVKKCEYCGKEFSIKSYEKFRYCSVECGNQQDISDEDIIISAINFVKKTGVYPTVITWENFEDAVSSRELIRKRFGNFQNLNDKLVERGIFASLTPNSKMSQKMIAGAIVDWTIKNGRGPTKKDMTEICSTQSLIRNGGFEALNNLANKLCENCSVNHKVVSVEILKDFADVYNITVDEHHNLCILSSHNSKPDTKHNKLSVSRYRTVVYKNCGEQPLPPFGVCNLGSVDVAKFFVLKTDNPSDFENVDWARLKKCICAAVKFLDDVVSNNTYPSIEFEEWAKKNRPIGLGIMGLADLFLKMQIEYGSEKSFELAEKIAEFFYRHANKMSVQLAEERGTPDSCNFKELNYRRSVTLLTIAPTGSISLIAGCSSSIEPIFSSTVFRNDNTGQYEIPHPDSDKPWFKCAIDKDPQRVVSWESHVKMQAVFQKYIDSGVSKTINMSNSATIEDVVSAYMFAWKNNCKGITIYRDGSKTVQVLNSDKTSSEYAAVKRPKTVNCDIHKTKADGIDWHIIIGKIDEKPYELFAVNGRVELPKSGRVVKNKKRNYTLTDEDGNVLIQNIIDEENHIDPKIGLETRRFSLELRHRIPAEFIVQQIDNSNEHLNSFSKVVGRLFKTKYLESGVAVSTGMECPECAKEGKTEQMIKQSSCVKCPACHYSKCG